MCLYHLLRFYSPKPFVVGYFTCLFGWHNTFCCGFLTAKAGNPESGATYTMFRLFLFRSKSWLPSLVSCSLSLSHPFFFFFFLLLPLLLFITRYLTLSFHTELLECFITEVSLAIYVWHPTLMHIQQICDMCSDVGWIKLCLQSRVPQKCDECHPVH